MTAVASFDNGSHRQVLLVPCDDRQGNGEDCQDSANLNNTRSIQANSTLPLASSTRNDHGPTSLPLAFQTLLARRLFRIPYCRRRPLPSCFDLPLSKEELSTLHTSGIF